MNYFLFFFRRYYANGKGVLADNYLASLKIVRNFGHIISNLIIEYCSSDTRAAKILFYVIKYCSKSLHTLMIRRYNSPLQSILKSNENPFTNLKKLYIRQCYHGESNLWKFDGVVFPNLQTLKFNLNNMRSVDFISPKMVYHIKSLKSFSFDDTYAQYNDKRIYTDIVDMIKLNTHLEKFEIALLEQFDEQSFEALMRHLECLPNLRRLNLIFSGPESVFNVHGSYHFDNVVDFGLFNTPSTFITKIPFTFNQLKRFTITTANITFSEHLNHSHIWDFLANNKHLTSIFLHGKVNGSFITNYEHFFSNVEELYINGCQDIPIDIVLDFLKNRLKKLKISGTRKSFKGNSYDICDILECNKIEFEAKIVERKKHFSFLNCFIKCDWLTYNVEVDLYSNDELKCYIPLINPYYAEYIYSTYKNIHCHSKICS